MRTHHTTPGDVLKTKVLSRMDITQEELANALGVSRFSVNQILNSRRSVTPEMAVRLAHVLDTSPELWLNLQMKVDLAEAERELKDELKQLKRLRTSKIS
ncbi:HigA family addiction module antitoxin [Qipengyuania gaetbuli]|uniref:HigA family addiction module antitoxin n=1 Tax=Qipengyuania gaetbuli TaxID=266952 RepID=UPI001CD32A26|nr:HigA family addiction module antitoxin [Qipengyuania gaetbuli]MCA0909041.1 HigA family addiction module antidote protein [Qipengyuania gaetbuli]